MPMPNLAGLLARYTLLFDEYKELARRLWWRYEDTYGMLRINHGAGAGVNRWVTCPTVLARQQIGCMPGVMLHLHQWRCNSVDVILDFDMAWAPGVDKPIRITYEVVMKGLVGLIALYQAGLGWIVRKITNEPHTRLLEFISRAARSTLGHHEPSGRGVPREVTTPEGVGVVNRALVVGWVGAISIHTGGDWHFIPYEYLRRGLANGLDGYVVPFIEWAYDTLGRAYNTLLGIGQVLGLEDFSTTPGYYPGD